MKALSEILAQRTDLQTSFGTPSNPKLGVLIDWASAGSDSDASKLLPFWPELQVVGALPLEAQPPLSGQGSIDLPAALS